VFFSLLLFLQGDGMAVCNSWRPLDIAEICGLWSAGSSNITQGSNI